MTAVQQRASLLEFALSFPETWRDAPWGEEDVVVKVRKKIFVFLGSEDDPSTVTVKLRESQAHAMSLPGSVPTGYGLGRHGWVTVPLDAADTELLCDWVEE
ncbi:MAG: MmcQ/YjbR family DNA-binding protein, partial [Stackebrandtia sp.]